MRWFFLCGCFFVAVSAPVRAEKACSQDSLLQASANVQAVREQLLAVKVSDQGMNTDVSSTTVRLIHTMKDDLAITTDALMDCEDGPSADAALIETNLANLLRANQPQPTAVALDAIPEEKDRVYGSDLKIAARKTAKHPELIGVQISFGVNCGEDTMLLVYERRSERWSQALRWQSGDYRQASGAFGDFFEYAVISGSSPNKWAVATAHGKPWCTSVLSGFDLDVVQPAHGRIQQQLLFHEEHGYVRDRGPEWKAFPDGFELRVEEESLDFAVFWRPGIYRYRMEGGKMHRLQPIAKNGRDFVDEWLEADWSEAAHWSAAANLGILSEEHARIATLRDPKSTNWPSFTYGAVRGCADDSRHFQVELNQDPSVPTYFEIQKGENRFTMLSARSKSDPQCTGADITPKRWRANENIG